MKKINNIVFTKNRPLQLEAYLESLYKHFPEDLIQTFVLWKQQLFTEQYQQLFNHFPNCTVIKENDFSSDFFNILSRSDTKYVLFGIDDVVYFDSVPFDIIEKTFDGFDDIFGFSLRFGRNVLTNGEEKITQTEVSGQKIYKVNWHKGHSRNTRYPFELCATIYRTELVKEIINTSRSNNPLAVKLFSPNSVLIKSLEKTGLARKVLKRFGYFYSPNTLESWNCRWCQENKDKLPIYIYFQKLCASAVQVNMVNTTTRNGGVYDESLNVEALNDKYKKGWRFDIDFVAQNKPAETHCKKKYFHLYLSKAKNP